MIFTQIDKEIYDFCVKKGITYSRFIDDVTLSSQQDIKLDLPGVIIRITEGGFSISPSKTSYKRELDITGISVGNNSMNPNKKFFDKLQGPISEASKKGMLEYLAESKKDECSPRSSS